MEYGWLIANLIRSCFINFSVPSKVYSVKSRGRVLTFDKRIYNAKNSDFKYTICSFDFFYFFYFLTLPTRILHEIRTK